MNISQAEHLRILYSGLRKLETPEIFSTGCWKICLIGHAAQNGIGGWLWSDGFYMHQNSAFYTEENHRMIEESVRDLYGVEAYNEIFGHAAPQSDNWEESLGHLEKFMREHKAWTDDLKSTLNPE